MHPATYMAFKEELEKIAVLPAAATNGQMAQGSSPEGFWQQHGDKIQQAAAAASSFPGQVAISEGKRALAKTPLVQKGMGFIAKSFPKAAAAMPHPAAIGALLAGGRSVLKSVKEEHHERGQDIRAKLGPERTKEIRRHRLIGHATRAGAHAIGGALAGEAVRRHGGTAVDYARRKATDLSKHVSTLKDKGLSSISDTISKGIKSSDVEGQVERGVRKGIPGGSAVSSFLGKLKNKE